MVKQGKEGNKKCVCWAPVTQQKLGERTAKVEADSERG